jgi:hypothetical protein
MEELPQIKIEHGIKKAWDAICALEPEVICKNALATFDPDTSTFTIKSFGFDFRADTANRTLTCTDEKGEAFLGEFREFLRLGLLWYMTSSKDIPATGKLVKPSDVKGGHIYVHGTHKLPLGEMAEGYKSDIKGFLHKGHSYGAEQVEGIGDAAICLYPLPRIPVTVVLRVEDEEEGFPAEMRLFFDSTLDFQVAPDIGWSLAMTSCLSLLSKS